MRLWKDDASTSTELRSATFSTRHERFLDIIAAVKGLHELTPQQLSKLIRDSGNNLVQHIAEDGSHIQIDVEKFARYLPVHFIAVVMAWQRDKSTFKYLLCGVLLLHAMCDLATRLPKIEQILLDDVKVSEQLIDMVAYLLVVLGAYRQENHHTPNDIVLLHSALVACSLKLLTVILTSQYQEIAQVLTTYHKVDIFMHATFAAVRMDIKVLQAKLSPVQADSTANTSPTNEETLIHLCQQCECSLNFLQSLCQQKLFRERVVKNKELCGKGGILPLVQAVMKLKLSPIYGASSYLSSVSLLQSKALSVLLLLCEAESVSYLDEVASTGGGQDLVKSIALEVLELLKKMFGVNSKQLTTSSEIVGLKGQLELNAMRLADVFSDDSNFRSFIMMNFTEALAALFSIPHGEFLSGWCSSHLPQCEENATLDVPCESYSHHMTSLLIKVIADLHCFVPDVCQDEKDLFLNTFVRFLQKEPQSLSNGNSSTFDAEKTTTVSKNLCSLLSHAESLVPRFLNEDDLQLLRLFRSQFESLVPPAAYEDHPAQVVQSDGVHSLPIHGEPAVNHANGDMTIEEDALVDVAFQKVDQLDVGINANNQSIDGERKCEMVEQRKPSGSNQNLRDIEKEDRTVEASGSDSSSTRGKTDQMDVYHVKGSGFEEAMEDEKVDAMHSDERQQRKRKRPVMNENQIALIEAALVDEPNMHRNSNSLKLWADRISLHGAEVTTSRLKNWLNNRKARLARIAKDTRVSNEGNNLDRQGSSGQLDIPQSPTDDTRVPSARASTWSNEVAYNTVRDNVDEESTSSPGTPRPDLVCGQCVKLLNEKGKVIGRGDVFRRHGEWCGISLYKSPKCVVDVYELWVDKYTKLPHPTEVAGNSFDEAKKKFGLFRVLWDVDKLIESRV